jgi:hypothetical protein
MHYNYRYWYAMGVFLLINTFAYFIVLHPEQQDLTQLSELTRQSTLQLTALKKFAQEQKNDASLFTALAPPNKFDFFNLISTLAHQSNVAIQSINMELPASLTIKMHVVTQGEFSSLIYFALSLLNQPRAIFVSHFSFHVVPSQPLLLSLDLFTMQNNIDLPPPPPFPISLSPTQNPFCQPNHSQPVSTILTTPLAQMRMTGYLAQGNRKLALMTLPTGEVISVEEGMVVGKELGVVKKVGRSEVVVVVGDGVVKILALEE